MPRPLNSLNKNKDYLNSRLKDMYGDDFDPIMKACDNAIRMQSIADKSQEDAHEDEFVQRKECVSAWDKVAQYTTPKLKAIEVSGEIEHKPHEDWFDMLDG